MPSSQASRSLPDSSRALPPGPHAAAHARLQVRVLERTEVRSVGGGWVHLLVLIAGAADDLGAGAKLAEDRLGEVGPGADAPVGAVVDAVVLRGGDRQDLVREVVGAGGVAHLVVHDRHGLVALRQAQHGLDEVLAHIAIEPRGAHHKRARVARQREALAGKLGAAVGADGRGDVGLEPLALHVAREHVVGGDVHELCPLAGAGAREVHGTERVGAERAGPVCLAAVHVGERRAVDGEVVGTVLVKPRVDRGGVRDVERVDVDVVDLRVAIRLGDGADLGGPALDEPPQLVAELPARTSDKNPHETVSPSPACRAFRDPSRCYRPADLRHSSKEGCLVSLSERLSSTPSTSGHSTPMLGSFHMRPPSSLGWYTSSHL